jgi:hypothetical protein
MKKHLLYLFLFALALGSCKKDKTEPILGNVDDRLSETLTAYQTQLAGAQFGWKGYLLTDTKVLATFLFSFTDKNRTTMSADYEPTPNESSYRLKALQRPTLLFDTYSILHLIADPTPSKFDGEIGAGYYSDFEFAFLSASADTIKLEGTFNKSKLILVRSKSAADNASAFTAPDDMTATLSKLRTYFKRATLGGLDCEVKLDPNRRVLGFDYLEAGVLKTATSNYFVSGTSLILFSPLVIGSTTITGLNGVSFDAATGSISASTSGGGSLQIKEAIAPLQYDKTVAARFLANPIYGTYSECYTGIIVDGVYDAYGVGNIPGFVDVDFIPKQAPTYGALIVYTSAGYLSYFPRITSIVNANGIMENTLVGVTDGTPTTANSSKAIIDKVALAFTKVGGFYVIQTDTKMYDLVAVADARSWLTFE